MLSLGVGGGAVVVSNFNTHGKHRQDAPTKFRGYAPQFSKSNPMEEIKPTAEELAAEEETLKPIDETEVRTQIIAELGLDETEDAEKIAKATSREVKQREITQAAIKAKIKHRDTATELAAKAAERKDTPTPPAEADVDKKVNDAFEKRDLAALDLPDDLKAEIQRVAQISCKTVREVQSDPYIASKIESFRRTQEAEEAGLRRTHQNSPGGGANGKIDPMNPPEFDMSTVEGRKAYDDWMAKAIAAGG